MNINRIGKFSNLNFKANSEIEISYFEHFIRDYLNFNAERAMFVENPIKVTITNYDKVSEELEFDINPNKPEMGKRKISFSNVIYIDSDDFSLDPPPKYFRLKLGGYVRLKNAYIIKCDDVVLNEDGTIKELLCSYAPNSKSGEDVSGIKCKGVIHWVDSKTCVDMELKKYEYLLKDAEFPGQDFSERMNYNSVHVYNGKAEKYLEDCAIDTPFQLLRKGYFKKALINGKIVMSEIVTMKDSFNKK